MPPSRVVTVSSILFFFPVFSTRFLPARLSHWRRAEEVVEERHDPGEPPCLLVTHRYLYLFSEWSMRKSSRVTLTLTDPSTSPFRRAPLHPAPRPLPQLEQHRGGWRRVLRVCHQGQPLGVQDRLAARGEELLKGWVPLPLLLPLVVVVSVRFILPVFFLYSTLSSSVSASSFSCSKSSSFLCLCVCVSPPSLCLNLLHIYSLITFIFIFSSSSPSTSYPQISPSNP